MSKVELYLGDCLEVMPQFADSCADAIIADWPYGTTACKWDVVIPFKPLWVQCKRVIKRKGAIVLFGSQPFTSALVMSNSEWFRHEWIWDKKSSSCAANSMIAPKRVHEHILVFSEKSPVYNPIFWDAGRPNGNRGSSKRAIMSGRRNRYQDEYSYKPHENLRYPQSIIRLSFQSAECNNTKRLHSQQKPIALLEYIIKTYTNEGETVLDNTMGSGTTGVACVNTGRNFIGIEQDAEHFANARRRIEHAQNELLQLEFVT